MKQIIDLIKRGFEITFVYDKKLEATEITMTKGEYHYRQYITDFMLELSSFDILKLEIKRMEEKINQEIGGQ